MMSWSRSVSPTSIPMRSRSRSATPSWAASSQPRRLLSGVRSSWETSLTIALRWSSNRARCSDISLNAAASCPISPESLTSTRAVPCPARMRRTASVSARTGRTRRVDTATLTTTVSTSTSSTTPATRRMPSRDRDRPVSGSSDGSSMNSSAAGAT
ncbi:hypothetical protein GCM10009602_10250 [Nocardiopsis tropica]